MKANTNKQLLDFTPLQKIQDEHVKKIRRHRKKIQQFDKNNQDLKKQIDKSRSAWKDFNENVLNVDCDIELF